MGHLKTSAQTIILNLLPMNLRHSSKTGGSIIVPHQLVTPQLNGHAELAVKAAKQIIMGNLSPNGDLNNDKTA